MPARTRPKKIVAIDWDAQTLRVVYAATGKRGVKIDRIFSARIPASVDSHDPQQMGDHIRRTLDHEGITTRHAIVDIPRDQAVLNTLTLPTGQPEELPGMVAIQIAKELPFPVAEAVIDFVVGAATPDSATGDVMVAAVRCEVLKRYEATFAAAGLKLDRIGLRPYASKVAVTALLKHAPPERVLFIDLTPTFMEIDVLRDAVLVFSRSASVSMPTEPTAPETLRIDGGDLESDQPGDQTVRGSAALIDTLMMEVLRSIEAYRAGDPGMSIEHAVIGGDVGVEEALAEAIHKRLSITTELYNPASTFGWEPDEGADASAYAASLGLVLGHAEDAAQIVDFLDPKKTVSVTKERLRKAPLAAAVGILFVAAASVVVAGMTKPGRDKLARIEREIAEIEDQQSEFKKFLKLVDRVEAFDTKSHVWVDVLYDIVSVMPSNRELIISDMMMAQFEVEKKNAKKGQITFTTQTKASDTPSTFIARLRDFRRDGRTKPRFAVTMGPQTEKKGEPYPYHQKLWISVLDDEDGKRGGSMRRSRNN